jgi:PadR family transcriptional regulator PadR
MARAQQSAALLPGTLELLVLSVLMAGDAHAYAVARAIERTGEGTLRIEEGSLYPCVARLTRQGLVTSTWDVTPTGRRARVYAITGAGRRHWAQQHTLWLRLASAVDSVVAAHT